MLRRSGTKGAGRGEKSRQCSIGPVRGRLAWLIGAAGVAAFVRGRTVRREALPPAAEPGADLWADELRQRLDAARVAGGDEDLAEEPADAPDASADLEQRRRQVHDVGRAAVDEMRS